MSHHYMEGAPPPRRPQGCSNCGDFRMRLRHGVNGDECGSCNPLFPDMFPADLKQRRAAEKPQHLQELADYQQAWDEKYGEISEEVSI